MSDKQYLVGITTPDGRFVNVEVTLHQIKEAMRIVSEPGEAQDDVQGYLLGYGRHRGRASGSWASRGECDLLFDAETPGWWEKQGRKVWDAFVKNQSEKSKAESKLAVAGIKVTSGGQIAAADVERAVKILAAEEEPEEADAAAMSYPEGKLSPELQKVADALTSMGVKWTSVDIDGDGEGKIRTKIGGKTQTIGYYNGDGSGLNMTKGYYTENNYGEVDFDGESFEDVLSWFKPAAKAATAADDGYEEEWITPPEYFGPMMDAFTKLQEALAKAAPHIHRDSLSKITKLKAELEEVSESLEELGGNV